jgi:hypothetical protein
MTALIGIVAAAAALATPLPPLPAEGLVLSRADGITFVNLQGRRLGHVDGLRFAPEYALNSGVPRLRDRQGRLWSLDVRGHRLIPAVGGLPLAGGATLLFAPRAKRWLVLRRGRIALRMPVGHEFPFLSEDRDVVSTGRRALDLRTRRIVPVPRGWHRREPARRPLVLLCGRIEHGTPPESRTMGWSPTGRPVVSFLGGSCGSGYHGGTGVYSLDPDGMPRLIVRTKARRPVAFWG